MCRARSLAILNCLAWSCFLPAHVAANSTNYVGVHLYTVIPPYSSSYSTNGCFAGQVTGANDFSQYPNPTQTEHAMLWFGPGEKWVDLHPAGFDLSIATNTDGTRQVGQALISLNSNERHALLWSGTPQSVVDLQPPGFVETAAYGIHGQQQVGYGSGTVTSGKTHALLWSNTAGSVVDLHPAQYDSSSAWTTDGTQQVGWVKASASSESHAMMWSGTAGSAVDLHPTTGGYAISEARGVGGGEEVGWGAKPASQGRALLWHGTPDSPVDLTPAGFMDAIGIATDGMRQVGSGGSALGEEHALLWYGSAESFVDLHLLLPTGFTASAATSIDSQGNIYGSARGEDSLIHAVEWVVPEPASGWVCVSCVALLTVRRRGTRRG